MSEAGYERMKRMQEEFKAEVLKKMNHIAVNYHNDPLHIAKTSYKLALEHAVGEIEGWVSLLIKAHESAPYSNPKEAEREHKNTMNLLATIKSKLSKKADI